MVRYLFIATIQHVEYEHCFSKFFFLVSLISFIPCSYSPLIVLTCTLTCILFTNDRTGRDNVSVHGISILSLDVRYHWLSESGYMSTKDPERKSSSESNVDRDDITSRYVTPGFKPFSVLNFHWHSDSVVGMVMLRANNGITSLECFIF